MQSNPRIENYPEIATLSTKDCILALLSVNKENAALSDLPRAAHESEAIMVMQNSDSFIKKATNRVQIKNHDSNVIFRIFLIIMLFFLIVRSTNAENSTGVFNVVARVQNGCAVAAENSLDFGDINLMPGQDIDAQGSISFTSCSGTLQFSIDGGQSRSINDRSMKNNGNLLRYQLYRNPTRTSIWGQGADAREIVLLNPGSGSVTVYGRIPRGQEVPGGTYTDTLAITLSF